MTTVTALTHSVLIYSEHFVGVAFLCTTDCFVGVFTDRQTNEKTDRQTDRHI